jgi:hypothetical protein
MENMKLIKLGKAGTLCLNCNKEKATNGVGEIKRVCSKCWNSMFKDNKSEDLDKVLGILEDVYGWNDTNQLTEKQKELVSDVISVVKKLGLKDVGLGSLFCEDCNVDLKRANGFCPKYIDCKDKKTTKKL